MSLCPHAGSGRRLLESAHLTFGEDVYKLTLLFMDSSAPAGHIAMLKPHLELRGVDHVAKPTWKLAETVHFYQDILGLRLVHAITAKGWGRVRERHADFVHFFFDTGNGSHIAFFYYVGTSQPSEMAVPRGYMAMGSHTAWRVNSRAELMRWRERLVSHDVRVSDSVQHELFESIYFRDPNHYPLEVTTALRALNEADNADAQLTISAAISLERAGGWTGIEELWKAKAGLVRQAGALGPVT
jgi:catechol 2,3-dioxygenase-like lactoylglutathione lyase family enzyme